MVASEASGAQTGTLENYNAAVDLIGGVGLVVHLDVHELEFR